MNVQNWNKYHVTDVLTVMESDNDFLIWSICELFNDFPRGESGCGGEVQSYIYTDNMNGFVKVTDK